MQAPSVFDQMAHNEVTTLVDSFWWHFGPEPPISLIVILRGLPGTGKSTFASLLKLYASTKFWNPMICCADQYFDQAHGYQWDRSKLEQAHAYCKARFEAALAASVPVIIVDNSNIQAREYGWYIDAAVRHGNHEIHLVNFQVDSIDEALELNARGVHGVERETIERRFAQSNQQHWQPSRRNYVQHNVRPILNTWDS
jgi:tRNA uridine 5-carbamoylmethylation protein Kti12